MATSDKYDRQLRLWGAKGQRALGNTQVVLVGASAAGTETLKNLVLPGIGSFLVVDEGTVSKEDASSNFFLPSVGKSRAETAARYLREMNPDVEGHAYPVPSLSQVSDWKPVIFHKAAGKRLVVIGSDLEPSILEKISDLCTVEKLAFVVVQSYGLIGLVRIQLSGTVALLNPKPANAHPDLRLAAPFPALDEMARSIDLSSLKNHEHSHVPYPIILIQALKTWRQSHDGKIPKTFAEKQDFQKLVNGMRRDDNEINFEEAVQNAYLAYTEQTVETPEELDPLSTLGKLYQGLRAFSAKSSDRPPLNGSIPDMTSSTDWYVQLQGIYKEQSEKDLATMKELCAGVSEDDVESFCANVFMVQKIETRSVVEEFRSSPPAEIAEDLNVSLMDPYDVPALTPLLWYLGLRACQKFFQEFDRYPGTLGAWEDDAAVLYSECWSSIATHYQLAEQELVETHGREICQEMARHGNAEIHTVASIVGGVAAQEAVKITTGQYIPLDNAYIFNGIASVAGVYKL